MFLRYIIKKIASAQRVSRNNYKTYSKQEIQGISKGLKKNLDFVKSYLGDSEDVIIHEFDLGEDWKIPGALIYIDGLTNTTEVNESILKPMLLNKEVTSFGEDLSMGDIRRSIVYARDIVESNLFSDIFDGCFSGKTIMLLDGFSKALIIGTEMWEKRSVEEPQTESVVRGPREGFTEDYRTNTSLIRRRIKTTNLKMEHMNIGTETATSVCIAYIKGIAKPEIIQLLRTRLESINTDAILDSGYIEEYIEESPLSIFSTVGYSEKPDVVAAKILEGRIGIIVDGSPFVLTVPMLFIESFQSAEDYYSKPLYSSITRLLRFFCFFIAIFAVPSFIALSTFHQELIPTTLLFTIANAREGTPFPAFFEGLIMITSFEILREAGLRLPRPVGQAISIVGALIMGDAAVSAGIVGAPMVITVAITSVASFIIPTQTDSISIIRVIIMVLAASLGGFGIAIGFLAMLVHLARMTSFGIPYFDSVIFSRDQQDSFIRIPMWLMRERPKDIAYENKKRKEIIVPPIGSDKNIRQEGQDNSYE